MLLGTHINWRMPRPQGFRPVEKLEEELASNRTADTIGRDLSAAVRLGLLEVVSDPSPGRACVYRVAVPTGAAVAPAEVLPLDLHQGSPDPVEEHLTPGEMAGCDSPSPGEIAFEHPARSPFEHPARWPTYPVVNPEQDSRTNSPLPPSPSTARPLMAVVIDGETVAIGPPGRRTPLAPAPIPKHVELVSHGLVQRLGLTLPERHSQRWKQRVAVEVARLLAGGWSGADDLAPATNQRPWDDVDNPLAVLVSRLRSLPTSPAEDIRPAQDVAPF